MPDTLPCRYLRETAPSHFGDAAGRFEARFGIRFSSLLWFPPATLPAIDEVGPPSPHSNLTVVSSLFPQITDEIHRLTQIANKDALTRDDRECYQTALTNVYSIMRLSLPSPAETDSTLYVGVQREGRRLAELMGWLPDGCSIRPHAKRIPTDEGLLVGLSDLPIRKRYDRCVIVDGAIASGSTIIALIHALHDAAGAFEIRSVHAAPAGLQAITNAAMLTGIKTQVFVGHASGRLNSKFYAVDEEQPKHVIVGDLGDILAGIDT